MILELESTIPCSSLLAFIACTSHSILTSEYRQPIQIATEKVKVVRTTKRVSKLVGGRMHRTRQRVLDIILHQIVCVDPRWRCGLLGLYDGRNYFDGASPPSMFSEPGSILVAGFHDAFPAHMLRRLPHRSIRSSVGAGFFSARWPRS